MNPTVEQTFLDKQDLWKLQYITKRVFRYVRKVIKVTQYQPTHLLFFEEVKSFCALVLIQNKGYSFILH